MRTLIAAAILALALPAAAAPAQRSAEACAPEGGLSFVCGIKTPEDLVAVPGTNWILAGSMAEDGTGGLYLLDPRTRGLSRLYPAGPARIDRKLYPDCDGPPAPRRFSAHGLSIRARPNGRATLYVIGHGGREAVEVFHLTTGGPRPRATWVGCVPAPAGASLNSVAGLAEGEILATSIVDKPAVFQDVFAGRPTGWVYARAPGGAFRKLPATNFSGDNGIEVTPDGRRLFVAATGARKLFRFERADMTKPPASVDLGFLPDNLRWAPDGRLLVAGERPGTPGVFSVVAVDPVSLRLEEIAGGPTTKSFSGVSSALVAAGAVWLGAHQGERIARRPLPPRR